MKKIYSFFFLLVSYTVSAGTVPFITTWETTTANESITIPTYPGETYNYTVDWGDGTITTNNKGDAIHEYSNASRYIVSITGVFPRIFFNTPVVYMEDKEIGNQSFEVYWGEVKTITIDPKSKENAEKLININQWGNNEWVSMNNAFSGCSNLQGNFNDTPNLLNVTDASDMFRGAALFNYPIANWDVSTITSMEGMFQNAISFNQPIGNWDVSSVITMRNMFNCFSDITFSVSESSEGLTANPDSTNEINILYRIQSSFNQNINNWDVSNVTDMSGMFKATNYNEDITAWDVSNVTTFEETFSLATSFNQNIGLWNMQNAINLNKMFKAALKFNQVLNAWNTSNVSNISELFAFADGFNSSISNWDTSSVVDMSYVFFDANQFNQIINSWEMSNVTTTKGMFHGAISFNEDISSWDVSSVIDMDVMFAFANNFNQDISSWNVGNVTTMFGMFFRANLFNQNINNWDVSSVIDMKLIFAFAENFNQDISSWNVGNVTNMFGMFLGALNFNQDIGSWDVTSVNNAALMFTLVTLSPENYDSLLIGWESQNLQPNVIFDGGNSQFCVGAAARKNMISIDSWIITDGGSLGPEINDMVDVTVGESYTLPTIKGTKLSGNEKYYTEPDGKGRVYNAGDIIKRADFKTYPVTLYIYDKLNRTPNNCISEKSFKLTLTRGFITTWQTTKINESIFIPTYTFAPSSGIPGEVYNYTVDWGDGSISTNQAANATHIYVTPGLHKVTITGLFPRVYFNAYSGSTTEKENAEKLMNVNQWGDNEWVSMNSAFSGCRNLQGNFNDVPNLLRVVDAFDMFREARQFNYPIGNWDVSTITIMSGIFSGAIAFNQDISGWNVSKVTNMSATFSGATAFNQDISRWNVSNVSDMSSMFNTATSFDQDIGNWNVSKVTNMSATFSGATAFNQDISRWDVSNVSDISSMFNTATSFDQDLGSWNVSNVTNATDMFKELTLSLENYDSLLIGWNSRNLQPNVVFSGGNSQFCAGTAARNNMISTDSWTITDGGTFGPRITDIADQRAVNTYTFPTITGVRLTGNEKFYLQADGLGTPYSPGDILTITDFSEYPITIYIYDQFNFGTTSCGSEQNFRLNIVPPVPSCTNLIEPVAGKKDVLVDTDVRWQLIPEAEGYILSVGTTEDGTDILDSVELDSETNTYDFSNDLPELTNIYVAVIPFNRGGKAISCIDEFFETQLIPRLRIPKFFTPNNDGINDTFDVVDPMNEVVSISLFNRYGKLLKQLPFVKSSWDGIYQNKQLPSDTYWYSIMLTSGESLKGSILLKR